MDYATTNTNTVIGTDMDYSTTKTNTASGTNCSYLTGCPHRLPCGYCMIMKTPCISSTSITWTNNPITITNEAHLSSSSSAVEVKA